MKGNSCHYSFLHKFKLYKFSFDNFLRTVLDAVHLLHPFQHLMSLLVNVHQMLLQRTFQNHHPIDNMNARLKETLLKMLEENT